MKKKLIKNIDLVISSTDMTRNELKVSGVDINYNGHNIHVNVDAKDTMKDLKL